MIIRQFFYSFSKTGGPNLWWHHLAVSVSLVTPSEKTQLRDDQSPLNIYSVIPSGWEISITILLKYGRLLLRQFIFDGDSSACLSSRYTYNRWVPSFFWVWGTLISFHNKFLSSWRWKEYCFTTWDYVAIKKGYISSVIRSYFQFQRDCILWTPWHKTTTTLWHI